MNAERRQRLRNIREPGVDRDADPVFVIAQLNHVGMERTVAEEDVLPQQDRIRLADEVPGENVEHAFPKRPGGYFGRTGKYFLDRVGIQVFPVDGFQFRGIRVEEDIPSAHRHRTIFPGDGKEFFEARGGDPIVLENELDPLPFRELHATVPVADEPQIPRVLRNTDSRVTFRIFAKDHKRVIPGVVVEHEKLEILERLGQYALEAFLQICLPVIGRDADGNQRGKVHCKNSCIILHGIKSQESMSFEV